MQSWTKWDCQRIHIVHGRPLIEGPEKVMQEQLLKNCFQWFYLHNRAVIDNHSRIEYKPARCAESQNKALVIDSPEHWYHLSWGPQVVPALRQVRKILHSHLQSEVWLYCHSSNQPVHIAFTSSPREGLIWAEGLHLSCKTVKQQIGWKFKPSSTRETSKMKACFTCLHGRCPFVFWGHHQS